MTKTVWVGMGCFWGAEKLLAALPGVVETSVGFAGGNTTNPSYKEVCSGTTGHVEVVAVHFDPAQTDLETILQVALENHDPTQGNRQGNDIGTQYRSVIFTESAEDAQTACELLQRYGVKLSEAGYGPITTEVKVITPSDYFLAEEYHQKYLEKNPGGYCPVHATGVCLS